VKPLLSHEIANFGRFTRAARPVMHKQGMLVQVGLEYRKVGRIDTPVRIIQVISRLARHTWKLVVCHDIASDQVSHAS
jgi:hypothetical protein